MSRASSLILVLVALVTEGCSGCGKGATKDDQPTTQASSAVQTSSDNGSTGTNKAFGAFCTQDTECAEHVCFHKRDKQRMGPDAGKEHRGGDQGPVEENGYCSKSCSTDADCPTPPTSGRCGARGMCKRSEK